MSKIKVMNELLANKIAAGEVVERCASIVKELVENAIDANSTIIKVNLIDGGLTKINVIDNGDGMDREDAVSSFQRHATSKIYKDDDLFFIETLGFRGEALASIASVSEIEMDTSCGEVGTHVHLKGGIIDIVDDSHARKGTSITVTNLFYNTPARLKYLKTEVTELNHCVSLIEKLALSHPEISFMLTNNDRVVVSTTGDDNLLKTIHEIYGLNVSNNMLEIKTFNDDFSISGFVSKPSVLRKNRNHLITLVNGRIVRNLDLNRSINDAYYTYKHDGFYPIVVINILVDPTLVDVNIHPTKQDIKMSKMDDLTKLLYTCIKNVLYSNLLIPDAILVNNVETYEKINDNVDISNNIFNHSNLEINEGIQGMLDFSSSNDTIVKNEEFKTLKLYPVGQVHGTYIIAENEDGMYIIDQHAAHERINYENTLKKIKNAETRIVKLLIPISMEFNPSDFDSFMENKDLFQELGFVFEEFGLNTIIIKAHPSWLIDGDEESNIREIVDYIITNKKKVNKEEFLDSLAKMCSCKMSIKANGKLSYIEMEHLLDDLVLCDNPYNCCHGRPLIIKFTTYELEKMFKRVL